ASTYQNHYRFCLLRRLGLTPNPDLESDERLVSATLELIASWPVGYGDFFDGLASMIQSAGFPQEPEGLPVVLNDVPEPARELWQNWRNAWWWQTQAREAHGSEPEASVPERLRRWNLSLTPTRSLIESLWEPIDQGDDWLPVGGWLSSVMKA
ncbi:MAG: protein adenylyltransferase SelO family protein, partial [Synechococcus sp. ChBW.bin.23]